MMTLSPAMIGIIIGGLIPAVVYAFTAIFQRAGAPSIGIRVYLVTLGLSVAMTGVLFFFVDGSTLWTKRSMAFAIANGVFYAIGTGLVSIAIQKYQTPISKLVPLYNMNTLIAVLLALWIFAEWKQVKPLQLIIGSALIVLGGTLVARA